MTQNRSKAALFRNNMGAVKGWIIEGYGLEAISEKLRDEYAVELSVEALRTYIRREFRCGPRELREKFSHEKNNILEQAPKKAMVAVGQESTSEKHDDKTDTTPDVDLNTLLDAGGRSSAVSNYFDRLGKKPK